MSGKYGSHAALADHAATLFTGAALLAIGGIIAGGLIGAAMLALGLMVCVPLTDTVMALEYAKEDLPNRAKQKVSHSEPVITQHPARADTDGKSWADRERERAHLAATTRFH